VHSLLKVENIDVFYGDLQVLWNVSFEVQKGEILAVIGSNGAGKSTILKTLAGLIRPASGTMHFNHLRLDTLSTHRRVRLGISLVPEGRGLFSGMSIAENLTVGAYNPVARSQMGETFQFVFELFPELKKRQTQLAGTLSGGEQQMVAIGRGLMAKPQVLLLDEPSLGLAPLITRNIFNAIEQVNKSGVTIVLVEQNVRMSLELADRAYLIENGRMVGHDGAKNLLNDQRVIDAYLGFGEI
jgi:branched-chain amino acid transport system ATP-binding protein